MNLYLELRKTNQSIYILSTYFLIYDIFAIFKQNFFYVIYGNE